MTNQEILNTLLVIGFLIITVCIVFVTFFFIKALKAIINLTQSLEETTVNIKQKLQMRFLTVLPGILVALVSKLIKRGR